MLPLLLACATEAPTPPEAAPAPAPVEAPAPPAAARSHAAGLPLPEALPPSAFTDLTGEERRYIEGNWKLLSTMRDVRLRPADTLEKMALTPGMHVVDLGAGTGYFAFRFSQAVGESGTVSATDIASGALKYMEAVIARESEGGADFSNIALVKNPLDGTGVAAGSADVVFVCSIHIFSHLDMLNVTPEQATSGDAVALMAEGRKAMIESISETLKPGGRFVYMEGKPGSHEGLDLDVGAVSALFARFGFEEVARHDHLEKMDMLILQKPE